MVGVRFEGCSIFDTKSLLCLQSCAIVGSSGSGKSTLLRILMRLYDVQSGSVRLEGVDVRDLRQESLRSSVAVVPQETVLFNET